MQVGKWTIYWFKKIAAHTGSDLKDPDRATATSMAKPTKLPNPENAVAGHIRGVVKQWP